MNNEMTAVVYTPGKLSVRPITQIRAATDITSQESGCNDPTLSDPGLLVVLDNL